MLAVAGIPPVLLGTSMVFSPAGTSAVIAKTLWNARIDRSDEHRLGVIYTGIYVLWFGVLMLFAAYDPAGQRDLARVAGLLLVLRAAQQHFRAHELASAYGVTPSKNHLHVGWLATTGVLLSALAGAAPPLHVASGPGLQIAFALRQIVLGLAALHGIAIGLLLALLPRFGLSMCCRMTGATRTPGSPQLRSIIQPLGTYMFAAGLMAGAARDGGGRHLAVALGTLVVTRGVMRWPTKSALRYVFGVESLVLSQQALALIAAGLLVALAPTAGP